MAFGFFRRRWVRRILLGMLIFLLLAGLGTGYWFMLGSQKLTISPETTHITGPAMGKGKIDYAAAVNAKYKGSTTPESNAVVLLVEAIGQNLEGFPPNPDFYAELGIPVPVKSSREFVPWNLSDLDKKLQWSEAMGQPETILEQREIVSWFDQQKEAFDLIEKAANRPDYYCPVMPRGQGAPLNLIGTAPLYGVHSLRAISNSLVLRSYLHAKRGNPDAGWNDFLTAMKLSRMITKSPFLIGYLVGVAIEANVCKAIPGFLHLVKPNAQQLDLWAKQMAALPKHQDPSHALDTLERYAVLSAVVNAFKQNELDEFHKSQRNPSGTQDEMRFFILNRSIDWDQGLREFNEAHDRMIQVAKTGDRKTRAEEIKTIMTDFRKRSGRPPDSLFLSSNERGKILCQYLSGQYASAFHVIVGAEDRLDQLIKMREVTFALAKYRAETGIYPKTLAELLPKHLTKILGDPFNNNKPLDYQLRGEGYVIHCDGAKPETPLVLATFPKQVEFEFMRFPIDPKGKDND